MKLTRGLVDTRCFACVAPSTIARVATALDLPLTASGALQLGSACHFSQEVADTHSYGDALSRMGTIENLLFSVHGMSITEPTNGSTHGISAGIGSCTER